MTERWYRGGCPNCAGAVQQNSKSVWCLGCGWARNRLVDPATGRPPARWGMLGRPSDREGI